MFLSHVRRSSSFPRARWKSFGRSSAVAAQILANRARWFPWVEGYGSSNTAWMQRGTGTHQGFSCWRPSLRIARSEVADRLAHIEPSARSQM